MLGVTIVAAAIAAFNPAPVAHAPPAAAEASPQSLARMAGSRIVLGFDGYSPPDALLRQVRRGRAGGVILYSRNVSSRAQVKDAVRTIQRARPDGDPPLLLLIDQEGGLVKRLPGAPDRSAEEMGADGRTSLARREGRATAENLRGVGVNVDLAPVADVGRPGSNVEREQRSFSSDPRKVARLAGGFAGGLHQGHVAAVAKHFPGLGAASAEDADSSRTVIHLSRSRLRAVDEVPFRALADDDVPLVMLSSAIYPAFSDNHAMFARKIVTRELRERLGFGGVALADDLDAPVVAGTGSAGDRAVRTARAGADLMMFAHSITDGQRGADALADAVRAGDLSRASMERAAERVRKLRERLAR